MGLLIISASYRIRLTLREMEGGMVNSVAMLIVRIIKRNEATTQPAVAVQSILVRLRDTHSLANSRSNRNVIVVGGKRQRYRPD